MNQQEYDGYEKLVREAELRAAEERTRTAQQDVMLQSQDRSMIKEQLDLTEELERIDFLLRGFVMEKDSETGETKWIPPKTNDMVILSDYGVHLIRNTVAWYLMKNTLLSNYDNNTILNKMEDFASDLNDTIFMEYEKVFQYPTFEDCKLVLGQRIRNKTKMRVYAKEIMGKKVSEEEKKEIETKILKEVEPIIERELDKIKEQIMKNKLKRFMLLLRQVQDAVHSTYNRAYNGIERKTLREHIHISETKGGNVIPQPQKSGLFGFFRKR